jgi:hypothetical protein
MISGQRLDGLAQPFPRQELPLDDEARQVAAGREALGEELVDLLLRKDETPGEEDAEPLAGAGGGDEDDRPFLQVDRPDDVPSPQRHPSRERVDLEPLQEVRERTSFRSA